MAYLTERIMDTVKTIATLNDSDNISLLDTLNGLNDLRGRNEWSLVQIITLDCERDDNGTLLVWHDTPNGQYTYDVIAPTFDESLIDLQEAEFLLYQEWRDTKEAERAEFTFASANCIDGQPGYASWVCACLITRLASVRYGALQTIQALHWSNRSTNFRFDNALTLNNR